VATQGLVIVYGVFTMGAGILLCNLFLHGSRRAAELVSVPRK
jgi:hypothetical protein